MIEAIEICSDYLDGVQKNGAPDAWNDAEVRRLWAKVESASRAIGQAPKETPLLTDRAGMRIKKGLVFQNPIHPKAIEKLSGLWARFETIATLLFPIRTISPARTMVRKTLEHITKEYGEIVSASGEASGRKQDEKWRARHKASA